jgi:elongator complex protein 3
MKEQNLNRKKIENIKKNWAKKHKRDLLPLNSEVLNACSDKQRAKLRRFLVTKPTRTLSGVSVVAIMAKPCKCPGACIYCPKGAEAPQSYTGYEPAAMRARANKFNPFAQVVNRLEQLSSVGHSVQKNELIIMGGTFPASSWGYQRTFVKKAFDGFNNTKSKSLEAAQKKNETADMRVVGLTIETRPDFVYPTKFLELGCTRVELGIQNIDDKILKKINRKHNVKVTADATKKLKDNAFKILYHVMPGLPGSTFKSDVEMFKKLFEDERFKPDMLKIYPTLVIKGTELYKMWEKGEYKPVDEDYMVRLLKRIFKFCPKWVRIMRIQRDIPSMFIEAGPIKSNLRDVVMSEIPFSDEIRFREAGQVHRRRGELPDRIELLIKKYKASGGDEFFISAEDVDKDILLGFCRLRIVGKKALVRELHVYGEALPLGKEGKMQHAGWGKKLLASAELLAKKAKCKDIKVISGVGVREYYKKLGYKLKNFYMQKGL